MMYGLKNLSKIHKNLIKTSKKGINMYKNPRMHGL